jgi:hypothetical protein
MNTQIIKASHLCAILMILLSAGCSPLPVSTPPAPDMAGGVYVHVAYEYFHWQEGLDVMIWYNAPQSSSCDSSGSTSTKTHVVQCQAISETGQSFDWQIETSDGLTGKFVLNNNQFDLTEGNVFVVSTAQGQIDIQQFQCDLSSVRPESESITEFGLNDPDIAEFIQWADWKSYANSTFGLGFRYPSSWFGPDEYVSDQNLRVEIGSDVVYPYGTDRMEQIYEVKNSYYVLIQYSKNDQNQYWKDTYQSLLNLQDGESLSDARSLVIRVRQLKLGRFEGIEYISTLSETAQTEPVYIRQVILFDEQSNVLTIMGTPNNVEIGNGAEWRDAYKMIDEANLNLFHQIVESITVY